MARVNRSNIHPNNSFQVNHLQGLLETAKVVPAIDQCEHYIGRHPVDSMTGKPVDSKGTIEFCKSKNITYMAFSPLGPVGQQPKTVLYNPIVKKVAKAHGVSTAQIGLAWVQQQGMVMATSCDNEQFSEEDLGIDQIALTDDEMQQLNDSPVYSPFICANNTNPQCTGIGTNPSFDCVFNGCIKCHNGTAMQCDECCGQCTRVQDPTSKQFICTLKKG